MNQTMGRLQTGQLTVEKLKTEQIDTTRVLINDVYAAFTPFTQTDENGLRQATVFVSLIDGRLISVAGGTMVESKKGLIRWACVDDSYRGACYSLGPIRACVLDLKESGAKQIGVENWTDAPYRKLLTDFESEQIRVKHDQLVMRLDMRGYIQQPPVIKTGYQVRAFRDGDEITWANVKNDIFGSSSVPAEFWTQQFLGVNMETDFDPRGFFFAEQAGEPIGICAGIVRHNRTKIGGTYPGGIGWTGVNEAHRGQGLGRALMTHSVNYLHDRGIAVTEVGTQFYRTTAVNLYESLGFCIHRASFHLIIS